MGAVLFQTADWSSLPPTQRPGKTGYATYRTIEFEGFRVRLVEYSENYAANHWCRAGHIVYCLEGELLSELSDGRAFKLTKGMSYIVSDEVSEHRSSTKSGATLLILDGKFLREPKPLLNPWKM
ncbi:MAG TPA: DHCW motif cupin fold protein [Chryseosolibacter sp.]|nr:DHCW motif cupin fold protein [Chryseosolibacter sp.]